MPHILIIPIVVLLLFLVAYILFRTALYTSSEEVVESVAAIDIDTRMTAEHLGRLIRCETVSRADQEKQPHKAFRMLHKELEQMYPRVHRLLEVERVSEHSLLYTWHGSNPELKPVLLLAHQDVVPAKNQADNGWEQPPFSGNIADGYVWGRGALDNKAALIGILEAVECLLQEGFKPVRTLMLAFGHDEEVGGRWGAAAIAALLQERGVELELVLDEGGMIISGLLPGVQRPLALIGVVEKGEVVLEIAAQAASGHASAPPLATAIGRLARAIARLEARPMPAHLDAIQMMVRPIASEVGFGLRLLLANTWLFSGLLKRRLSNSGTTNTLIRTTMAPTMLRGGVRENVLPGEASVAVDVRVFPGDSLPEVFEHVRKVVGDEGIQVRNLSAEQDVPPACGAREATPITAPTDSAFQVLAWSIRQVFTDCLVAPYLMAGATDSRHFNPLTKQVLRFAPLRFTPADIDRVHGENERLLVKACGDVVRFYRQFLLNATT